MKYCLKKGLKLLIYSTIYIILSMLYYAFFQECILGVFVGIGFLFLGFYLAYKNKLGFTKGLFVGIIGASGGIFLAILSLILVNYDPYSIYIILPWALPISRLWQSIPNYGIITDCLGHISVIIFILLTSIGGFLGKITN